MKLTYTAKHGAEFVILHTENGDQKVGPFKDNHSLIQELFSMGYDMNKAKCIGADQKDRVTTIVYEIPPPTEEVKAFHKTLCEIINDPKKLNELREHLLEEKRNKS